MNAVAAHVTGFQHIGLPTNDLEKTIEFYTNLGFEVAYATELPTDKVAFLKLQNICIETYQSTGEPCAVGHAGAIAHIALDVDDIEATWDAVKSVGYTPLEDEIQSLPFWAKGVRFFNIEGPNAEIVEFSQVL